MNYNPYAAPQAAPPQAAGAPQGGGPQPWEIGEVLSRAWDIYKANWGVLTGALVVMAICIYTPAFFIGLGLTLGGIGPGSDAYWPVNGGSQILNLLMQSFFMIGLYRIFLAAARGQTPQFGMLFSGGSRFLPYFGFTLLMLLAVFVGYVFLIIPGIIIGLGLGLGPLFMADTELGVIDSMKASWEAMNGQKLNYFLFLLVGGLLQLAGLLACCVGLLVTAPMFLVAQSIVFLRISGRGAAALPPAMGGGYGGPPPGYGGAPPGYGGPPPGYGGPPGGPPPAGGGYGGPPPGAPPGGYGPPGGGGGYGPGGGGYGPGGGGGYGPGGGGVPPR